MLWSFLSPNIKVIPFNACVNAHIFPPLLLVYLGCIQIHFTHTSQISSSDKSSHLWCRRSQVRAPSEPKEWAWNSLLAAMVLCGLIKVPHPYWFATIPVWWYHWYGITWATVVSEHLLSAETLWITKSGGQGSKLTLAIAMGGDRVTQSPEQFSSPDLRILKSK